MGSKRMLDEYRRVGENESETLARLRSVVAAADESLFVGSIRATPDGSRIMALATELLGDDAAARQWLERPAVGLGGGIPIRMLERADGQKVVLEFLERLEQGLYS